MSTYGRTAQHKTKQIIACCPKCLLDEMTMFGFALMRCKNCGHKCDANERVFRKQRNN